MRTVKIGEEGWLEKGFKNGLAAGLAADIAEGETRCRYSKIRCTNA